MKDERKDFQCKIAIILIIYFEETWKSFSWASNLVCHSNQETRQKSLYRFHCMRISIYVRTQALNTLNARSARVQFSESHHVLREELNVYSGGGKKKKVIKRENCDST